MNKKPIFIIFIFKKKKKKIFNIFKKKKKKKKKNIMILNYIFSYEVKSYLILIIFFLFNVNIFN